jgi:hypothetical protein
MLQAPTCSSLTAASLRASNVFSCSLSFAASADRLACSSCSSACLACSSPVRSCRPASAASAAASLPHSAASRAACWLAAACEAQERPKKPRSQSATWMLIVSSQMHRSRAGLYYLHARMYWCLPHCTALMCDIIRILLVTAYCTTLQCDLLGLLQCTHAPLYLCLCTHLHLCQSHLPLSERRLSSTHLQS